MKKVSETAKISGLSLMITKIMCTSQQKRANPSRRSMLQKNKKGWMSIKVKHNQSSLMIFRRCMTRLKVICSKSMITLMEKRVLTIPYLIKSKTLHSPARRNLLGSLREI
jgi:hypothetical protein